MTRPLEDQLRGYARHVTSLSDPVDVDAVVQREDPGSAEPRLGDYQGVGASEETKRSWWLRGVVSVAAAILLIGIVITSRSDDTSVVTDADEDSAVANEGERPPVTGAASPSSTLPPPDTANGLLAHADAFFAAYNAGDVATMTALFSEDTVWEYQLEEAALSQLETFLAWTMAQGNLYLDPQCTANEDADPVQVDCTFGDHVGTAQAVGAPPVPNTLTLTAANGAITKVAMIFGLPDYKFVNVPFDEWLAQNHPDDVDTGYPGGNTVAEAQQNGELRTRLGEEWAAYLDANGCTYDTEC